jgi:hypothetical protein
VQLQQLLRLEGKAGPREITAAVEAAVDTFIRAFTNPFAAAAPQRRCVPSKIHGANDKKKRRP